MTWLSFDLTKIQIEKILSKRNTSINLKFEKNTIKVNQRYGYPKSGMTNFFMAHRDILCFASLPLGSNDPNICH
ncbi:unnamed protein product [Candidatus Protochlamydia amoebophila UWE25]|uniref:Uncharacterized protein n=1 Tax=Protochlamydia amoebophila (strain UWE25) TaxID=264201 RepID=Q6MBI5_PARUW|nr:unnamed protein product [Candidatus Protochlamydia amoebophila UWE25]